MGVKNIEFPEGLIQPIQCSALRQYFVLFVILIVNMMLMSVATTLCSLHCPQTFADFCLFLFISGMNPPTPVASVVCHYNHTVSITISNVDDTGRWNSVEWQLENNPACEPTFDDHGQTVNYDYLKLPDCAYKSTQLADSIKYELKINATKFDPGSTGQYRSYDHLYYVRCEYDNQNRSTANFVPIVNRVDNDSSMKHTLIMIYYHL